MRRAASGGGNTTWRAERSEDEAVVRRAHVAHRAALLGAIGWPADALARLCDQQHDLQERHLATHHPDAERRMIERRGVAVGRLCLDKAGVPWRVVDVALVPEAQGSGLGTAALARVMAEARRAGVAVELHVGIDNPRAEALYRRLGFVEAIGALATHRRMIWTPPATPR